MKVRFIYDENYSRTIPACIIDARASIAAIKNQIGDVIKAYTDSQVKAVNQNTLPYKLETMDGNLAGYITLIVDMTTEGCALGQKVLRPAFQGFMDIPTQISTFITSNSWKIDILF